MTTEETNNNLNILIDPTFTNVNRLFVLAYRTADNRQSFSQFFSPNVMVKDYNVIIDKLAFLICRKKRRRRPKKNRMKRLLILVEIMNTRQVIY